MGRPQRNGARQGRVDGRHGVSKKKSFDVKFRNVEPECQRGAPNDDFMSRCLTTEASCPHVPCHPRQQVVDSHNSARSGNGKYRSESSIPALAWRKESTATSVQLMRTRRKLRRLTCTPRAESTVAKTLVFYARFSSASSLRIRLKEKHSTPWTTLGRSSWESGSLSRLTAQSNEIHRWIPTRVLGRLLAFLPIYHLSMSLCICVQSHVRYAFDPQQTKTHHKGGLAGYIILPIRPL